MYIKDPNQTFRHEYYHAWNEKYTRWDYQQTRNDRRKNREIEDRNTSYPKRNFFNEKSFSELWDNFSWYNIVGVPKELKRKKGQKKIFEEIMARSFPNLMKTVNSGIQESQQTPSKHQNLPRYSIIEWIKISDKREGLSSNMKKLSGVMDANTFIFLNVVVVLQLCNYVWYVMSVISENISSCMLWICAICYMSVILQKKSWSILKSKQIIIQLWLQMRMMGNFVKIQSNVLRGSGSLSLGWDPRSIFFKTWQTVLIGKLFWESLPAGNFRNFPH